MLILAKEHRAFIEEEAAKEKKRVAVYNSETEQIRLTSAVMELPAIIRQEILLGCLQDVCHKKRDIGSVQVAALEELFTSQVGKERNFIYGILAKRTYEGVTLTPSLEYNDFGFDIDFDEEYTIPLRGEGTEIVTSDGMRAGFVIKERGNGDIPTGEDRKWFDLKLLRSEALFQSLELRHPKRDDFLVIHRDGGSQKVYDFFKNEKIPVEERDKLWVLASDRQVFWIIGYRMGEFGKVNDSTREVLEIQITKEE